MERARVDFAGDRSARETFANHEKRPSQDRPDSLEKMPERLAHAASAKMFLQVQLRLNGAGLA
jgi:hypothetical protein